jgi:thymidine kinase
MFLEPYFKGQRSGWIEVICGSMFSGKTEELIRRLKRAEIAEQSIVVIKPSLDTRYDDAKVVSHDDRKLHSIPLKRSQDILKHTDGVEVVGIDEAQFFDDGLPEVCNQLALEGKRVIIAGLDLDYKGVPFGSIPHLMAIAEYVTKVHAICLHCGNLATHSYRIHASESQVLLGEKDSYEARCRKCFEMGNILKLPKKKIAQPEEDDPSLF